MSLAQNWRDQVEGYKQSLEVLRRQISEKEHNIICIEREMAYLERKIATAGPEDYMGHNPVKLELV